MGIEFVTYFFFLKSSSHRHIVTKQLLFIVNGVFDVFIKIFIVTDRHEVKVLKKSKYISNLN